MPDEQHKHKHHHKKKKRWWKWVLIALGLFLLVDAVIVGKLYFDAKKAVDVTYKAVKHDDKRTGSVNLDNGQPFSVLLLGSDTGEYGRTEQGRSDTIMVAAVTPKKTELLSIPRDTLVTIAGHPGNNKINAAYSYDGVSGALNTLQSYLDIPIDHYIEINMKGLEQLSEAIGPVKVDNDLEFTNLDVHFPKGEVTIDSDNILAYTRMRYEDPRGDYGRQLRQRQVLTALVEKAASIDSLAKYHSILNAISSNMKTDLTFDDIKDIVTNYSGAKNIDQIQLKGNGQMIDGVSYEVVPKENLDKVQSQLKQTLKLK